MLRFCDGFDHYALSDLALKWTSISSTSSVVVGATGRRSGGALRMTVAGSTRSLAKVLSASSTWIMGCAVQVAGLPAVAVSIMGVSDGATLQVAVRLNTDGTLSALRGTTVLGASTTAVSGGAYFYLEMKTTIHNTAGTIEIRVNGAPVLALTGQNTRSSANATADRVSIGVLSGGTLTVDFDDLYVCDGSGTTGNDFLGDTRVDTKLANADGTYTAFAPSTGTAHYANVDEVPPNTTDYNSGAAVGDRDSYRFPALEALSSQAIYGVQVNVAALKDDAGLRSIAPFVRSGGANLDGASTALSTSQTITSTVFETKPDGSAWTEAAVNAAEFGVVVTA